MTTATRTLDLAPAARRVAALLPAIGPEQLGDRTPCPGFDVATLLDHLLVLTTEFTHAARKTPTDGPVEPSAAHLDPDWRTELPDRLAELAAAWTDPEAWAGGTRAGGLDFPAAEVGVIALNELVVHGWDLARATRQRFSVDGPSAQACLAFAAGFEVVVPGLFGERVEVGAGAPVFHRVLGIEGRDPRWTP
ncbi:TIGR03086 family metal-binding protein [Pseudonocardia xishanensis]|uniref:TIGR03086 family metal-binding protein n=1 Tax=Pseudonocardia xishanensis TaxID=630995 RepID=A0ABP8RX52_9PSEU